MGTLWNTYAFFVLYANIDCFDPTKYALEYDKLSIMDRWLLSKLNSLIVAVDSNLEQYRITEAAKALDDFVDELSNWYVRRSRERFWGKGMPQDKINAYMTLYEALVALAKLSAPFVPFMAEQIYRNLVVNVDTSAPESVHLCLFPEVKTEWIFPELEASMEEVLKIVVEGRLMPEHSFHQKPSAHWDHVCEGAGRPTAAGVPGDHCGRIECESGDFYTGCSQLYHVQF